MKLKSVDMGAKVELTALQLVYLLDEAMETLCLRAEDGQEVDTMVIAKEKVLEFFGRTKVRGSEDGKDAGREPYYVKETASVYEVFNRNENNSSVAIFFKSQYSIEKAKERAEAECARLNAEHRKEQNNGGIL